MISVKTWPNFRQGTARDGVKVILEEQSHSNDVQFGKTKIFVRHPQTLLALETARSERIPGICTILQKMWRGTLARWHFKRLKAVKVISEVYCRYKLRSYLNKLADLFGNAGKMPDYGKRIEWPQPPIVLSVYVDNLKKAHARWRAHMILKHIPNEERPILKLKVLAADALKGRRKDWGYGRKWEANYLNNQNGSMSDANSVLAALQLTDDFKKVLFASFVRKTNRFGKTADRAVCITDKFIYKLESKKLKSMQPGIPLNEITGVSVSPSSDQLCIIHLQGGNDLVFCLQSIPPPPGGDRVGELIGILCNMWRLTQHKDLRVIVGSHLQCMLGNKSKTVSVEVGTKGPVFRKNGGDNLILDWPKPT